MLIANSCVPSGHERTLLAIQRERMGTVTDRQHQYRAGAVDAVAGRNLSGGRLQEVFVADLRQPPGQRNTEKMVPTLTSMLLRGSPARDGKRADNDYTHGYFRMMADRIRDGRLDHGSYGNARQLVDRIMDIVVAHMSGVTIFKGNRDVATLDDYHQGDSAIESAQQFALPTTYTPSSTAMSIGDINNDNCRDVVLVHPDHGLILLHGNACVKHASAAPRLHATASPTSCGGTWPPAPRPGGPATASRSSR